MTRQPDAYQDFAGWRGPRPSATVGDACREFTGTSLIMLLVWFARFDRGSEAAAQAAARLAASPQALPGTLEWLLAGYPA